MWRGAVRRFAGALVACCLRLPLFCSLVYSIKSMWEGWYDGGAAAGGTDQQNSS